jgi:putative peptidoglycan lipid II flippase
VVDCLSLALNAHGSFAIAALAPTINALVASALLVALPEWGLGNLIWGTLIGLTAQLALVSFEFHRRRIRLRWGLGAKLGPALLAGAAIIPGLIFANLSGLVPQVIAARLGDGAVATFSIAMRLHGAITQVLAIALSTVLLPHFASAVGRGDYLLIAGQLRKGFPIVAFLAVALLMWVGLVGELFVALAFERGAFDRAASNAVASVWFWLTVGLLPTVWGLVLAKVLQAMQLGATISAIALLGLVLTISMSLLLAEFGGLNGLALAVGLGILGTTIGCTVITARRLGMSLLFPAKYPWRLVPFATFAAATVAALVAVDLALRVSPGRIELVGITICVGIATALGLRLLLRGPDRST